MCFSLASLCSFCSGSGSPWADRRAWFDPAIADFKKAIARDGHLYLAWDRLGLSHETTGELDQAISDYSQEMALNPLGRSRLADADCTRGSSHPKKKYDAAIADYEKSIASAAPPTAARATPTVRCSRSIRTADATTKPR